METLAEYNFTLHHIPGLTNTVADLLSRRPDLKEGVQTVNDNITVLPDTVFATKFPYQLTGMLEDKQSIVIK